MSFRGIPLSTIFGGFVFFDSAVTETNNEFATLVIFAPWILTGKIDERIRGTRYV